MTRLLRDLDVLVLDCQAGGATPAHGDLLEIGWAVCGPAGIEGPVHQHWIVPRTERRVPAAIRELTGWSEACVAQALHEHVAWPSLHDAARRIAAEEPAPTLIHYARFELPFLRDLHARLGDSGVEFPFDTRCLHAIATRLFPDLPRRNIRALAGYLGHSTELIRRCAGHVEASAFIWRAVVPLLEAKGIRSWAELTGWLAEASPSVRRTRRVYPLAPERRRALPDRPGVYRFVRRNDALLYVGKAASLRKRVASHFTSGGRATERALELLTQVHDIHYTETPSVLEAALLESDEIKRLDPPYNLQLRSGERRAWFASRDLHEAVPAPDRAHRIGPLPSQYAVSALAALAALAQGGEGSRRLQAIALAVPVALLPDEALFLEGWRAFSAELLSGRGPTVARCIDAAARALWLLRGRGELESGVEDATVETWDLARVRRRLERNLIQAGLLVRRARWLRLLADADIAFREPGMLQARALVLARGEIIDRRDLVGVAALASLPVRQSRVLCEPQAFDAAAYDRLRVFATELRRVQDDGGDIAVRFGSHSFDGERLARLSSAV